jgi:hypothetical protein
MKSDQSDGVRNSTPSYGLLHRYATEFNFRYSNRAAVGVDDVTRTIRALKGAEGKRLTYKLSVGQAA